MALEPFSPTTMIDDGPIVDNSDSYLPCPEDDPFCNDDDKSYLTYPSIIGVFEAESVYISVIACYSIAEESPEWTEYNDSPCGISFVYSGIKKSDFNWTVYEGTDVCSVSYTSQNFHVAYNKIEVYTQPPDEDGDCTCFERSYWKQIRNDVGETETYTYKTDICRYFDKHLEIMPYAIATDRTCPAISTKTRSGWVTESIKIVYYDGPHYFQADYAIITRHYVTQTWECSECEDEDVDFPECDDSYYYSDIGYGCAGVEIYTDEYYRMIEFCSNNNGKLEHAYKVCVDYYRCKYKPGWIWVPDEDPSGTGGSWVTPEDLVPNGPWIPSDGDNTDFPGVGVSLDDYTSCCDFVPKDFIAWADGWNLNQLVPPNKR